MNIYTHCDTEKDSLFLIRDLYKKQRPFGHTEVLNKIKRMQWPVCLVGALKLLHSRTGEARKNARLLQSGYCLGSAFVCLSVNAEGSQRNSLLLPAPMCVPRLPLSARMHRHLQAFTESGLVSRFALMSEGKVIYNGVKSSAMATKMYIMKSSVGGTVSRPISGPITAMTHN